MRHGKPLHCKKQKKNYLFSGKFPGAPSLQLVPPPRTNTSDFCHQRFILTFLSFMKKIKQHLLFCVWFLSFYVIFKKIYPYCHVYQ